MVPKIFKKIIPIYIKIKVLEFLIQIKQIPKIITAKKLGIKFVRPNYLFKDVFDNNSVIVDVGCGSDADFSIYMIEKYNLKSIAIDPTIKHKDSLAKISKNNNGLFRHILAAISSKDGEINFNESIENMSGSLLKSHRNIKNGTSKQYPVKSISLKMLPSVLSLDKIKYIKLDLEGAEYDLIKNLKKEDVEKYNQIFIEFHHHCLPQYSKKDTFTCVQNIISLDFNSFTLDNHNFLFYRSKKIKHSKTERFKVVLEQYVIPHYRVSVYRELSKQVDLVIVASKNKKVDGLHNAKENLPFQSVYLEAKPETNLYHPEIFKVIEDYNADVLISLSSSLDLMLNNKDALDIIKHKQLNIIWTGCDGYAVRYFKLNLILNLIHPKRIIRTLKEIRAKSRVDHFLPYSSHSSEYLQKRLFVPKYKITVAHNAIDTSILRKEFIEWQKNDSKRVPYRIVFVGRLVPRKNIDLLIEAFKNILNIYPKASLKIIGEGSDMDNLKNIAEKLDVAEKVNFIGGIYDDKILANHLLKASLFVMPSVGGLGFNSAMACALPIIYTHADGTEKDIFKEGVNGWFFNGSLRDLTEKIKLAFKNPEKLLKMGLYSEKLITEEITIKNMVKNYMKAINKVSKNKRK